MPKKPRRRRSTKKSRYGPIIDVHCHPMLGTSPIMGTRPHAFADYLQIVGDLDIQFVGALTIAPRSDLSKTREQNDGILKLSKVTGGRFFPVCSVHPADGARAIEEVRRVAASGARAIKLHPNTQQFDVSDAAVERVVEEAARCDLPVLFDAYSPFDADQAGKFVRLAMRFPESKIILAHAHGPRFPDLLVYDILARYPWWRRNVWIDLSATGALLSCGPFAEQFTWVLRKVGADRLLFGSDYPLDDPRRAVEGVKNLGFSRDELRKIFFQNASELFKL